MESPHDHHQRRAVGIIGATNDGQFILYSVGWNETDDGELLV